MFCIKYSYFNWREEFTEEPDAENRQSPPRAFEQQS
jgi:hypothetical protein